MILKKKRFVFLSINKTDGWIDNNVEKIFESTKIPLYRSPKKCGKKCEFLKFCSFWGSSFTLHGLDVKTKRGCIRLCDCDLYSLSYKNFMYIFTYNTIKKYIPFDILKQMGLYKEPKISSKGPTFFDQPQSRNYSSAKYGKQNMKNTYNRNYAYRKR